MFSPCVEARQTKSYTTVLAAFDLKSIIWLTINSEASCKFGRYARFIGVLGRNGLTSLGYQEKKIEAMLQGEI
jgi:hypothetical protein